MQPDNAILSDTDTGINLPEAELDDDLLVDERKKAKYSKTAEFKEIQEHFQERLEFYQTYLPDGRPVATAPKKDLEVGWIVANILAMEFLKVINKYDLANEAVNNAKVPPSR